MAKAGVKRVNSAVQHFFAQSNPRGGGGGILIFSYIRRLGSLFGVQYLNFNIFGGKILWIFLGFITKLDYI